MRAAIEKLGQGTLKAGPSGVLRVLISYPAGFQEDTLRSSAGKAPDPIATVDLAKLVKPPLGSGSQMTLALRLEAAAKQKKREREDASTGKRTKQRLPESQTETRMSRLFLSSPQDVARSPKRRPWLRCSLSPLPSILRAARRLFLL